MVAFVVQDLELCSLYAETDQRLVLQMTVPLVSSILNSETRRVDQLIDLNAVLVPVASSCSPYFPWLMSLKLILQHLMRPPGC